jgi:hypothetical protein
MTDRVCANGGTVECEIFIPTRDLLRLLWERILGRNPNAKLSIAAGKIIIKGDLPPAQFKDGGPAA